eukprot:12158125-Karenia_brevis.AAC.1
MEGVARNMGMVELKRFAATFRQWLHRDDGSDLLVVPICRRERHRSIATKELFYTYLLANKDKYKLR